MHDIYILHAIFIYKNTLYKYGELNLGDNDNGLGM